MTNKMVWMTAEGYQKLQERLEELRTVKRPTLVKAFQEVSGDADWRGSAQMNLMQQELAQVDAEILRLEDMLAHCEVVEPHAGDAVVEIGETVVLQINGDVETYSIVGPSESAPLRGRISYESPVGHSLLKHKVGDDVTVQVPDGLVRCRILAVR